MRQFSRWAMLAVLGLAFAGCPATRVITARAFRVQRVVDGDTFKVVYDGEPTSVRILGIDAPELREPGGPEAKAALAGIVGAKVVRLAFPGPRKRDNFGRLLARVHVAGVDVAAELMRQGHAKPYRRR